jgi:hypothetical protein
VTDITVDVAGFPPAKSDALSMLAAGHTHAVRVKQLLLAVQQKLADAPFPMLDGPVGLEITLFAPEDRDPWLPANYVGAISEILQAKGHLKNQQRIRVELPEPLLSANLYRYERQLYDIRFRQMVASAPHYQVRVWSLVEDPS